MYKTKIESNNDYLNFYLKISKIIEVRRKELGLSLKDIEETTGLCSPAISRITNVLNKPRLDTLFKVLDALELEINIVRKENQQSANANESTPDEKKANLYNVWVKKDHSIELLKVKANSKNQARIVVSETNPEWTICTIEQETSIK